MKRTFILLLLGTSLSMAETKINTTEIKNASTTANIMVREVRTSRIARSGRESRASRPSRTVRIARVIHYVKPQQVTHLASIH